MEVLIVRKDRAGLGAVEVVVPNPQKRHENRDVLFQRGGPKVGIRLEGTGQKLGEVLEADRQRDRKPDRRPEGVAAADPVPELEHVVGVDSEFFDLGAVGRKRHKMLGHPRRVAGGGEEPLAGRPGVGHRLQRGEGLRGDDEQRRLGVERLERLGDMGAVDVRDEVRGDIHAVLLQRLGRHKGTQIGTSDPDVDHIGDRLAGVPLPLAGVDLSAELPHLGQNGVNFREDVLAVDQHRGVVPLAKGGMMNGAPFGNVYFLAGEHRLDHLFHAGRLGQLDKKIDGGVVDPVLRVVEKNPVPLDRVLAETVWVVTKHLTHRDLIDLLLMIGQGRPDRECRRILHDCSS